MRDRTAMAEPLTVGQQLVARWEWLNSGWSEPADLAQAIDDAIAAESEACAKALDRRASAYRPDDRGHDILTAAAAEIRARNETSK